MSIRSKLKDLVKTLSGSDATGKNTAELIGEINDAVAEGGGSGGGVFTFNATFDTERELYILDKTWQEIHDAFGQGRVCMCTFENEFGSSVDNRLGLVTDVLYADDG